MRWIFTALFSSLLSLSTSTTFAAIPENGKVSGNDIRVVPVNPSPDPNEVETRILYPKYKELKQASPVKGQIRLDGMALGVDTEDNPRKNEIRNDSKGQSLHIFIDNQPYFSVYEALIDALDDVDNYFDLRADFEIPFKLQPGMHVIRTFPCRSYNESVKADQAFTASLFYYQQRTDDSNIDLSKPYLTYNEPQGEFTYNAAKPKPILLDFYLSNCTLSKDGYKVRLTIDNATSRILTSWQPYYIYGLQKGLHKIRLQLLSPENKQVPGIFNDTERTISIK